MRAAHSTESRCSAAIRLGSLSPFGANGPIFPMAGFSPKTLSVKGEAHRSPPLSFGCIGARCPETRWIFLRSHSSLSASCSAPGPLHGRSGWQKSISRLCPVLHQASPAQLAVARSRSAPLSRSRGIIAFQLAWSGLLGPLGCCRAQPLSPAHSQTLHLKDEHPKALSMSGR